MSRDLTEKVSNTPKRRPTRKQYDYLRSLGSGSAIIVGKKRETEPYLRRGWVTAEFKEGEKHYPYSWIRITPEGARVLAEGMEEFGLPEIGPKPQTKRRVCADCGSTRYRFEIIDAEELLPA